MCDYYSHDVVDWPVEHIPVYLIVYVCSTG